MNRPWQIWIAFALCLAVVLAAVVSLLVVGGWLLRPSLPGDIDRVVVSQPRYPPPDYVGPIELVEPGVVADVVSAIKGALREPRAYKGVKSTVIDLYHGDKRRATLLADDGFTLLDFERVQYRDRSRRLRRILGSLGGTTLIPRWSVENRRHRFGEDIPGKYLLLNAGKVAAPVPERVVVHVNWFQRRREGTIPGWGSRKDMVFDVRSGPLPGADGDGVIQLKPGETATYSFVIPSEKLQKDETKLQLSFSAVRSDGAVTVTVLPRSDFYDLRLVRIE